MIKLKAADTIRDVGSCPITVWNLASISLVEIASSITENFAFPDMRYVFITFSYNFELNRIENCSRQRYGCSLLVMHGDIVYTHIRA